MENKYGEKFEYIDSLEDSAAEGTSAYLVKCDSLPGKDILVNVTNSENGSYSYTDNYIDHFLKRPLDRINEACSAVYGNFKVFMTLRTAIYPKKLNYLHPSRNICHLEKQKL